MRCGNCSCMITADKQKGHNYYRCTKKTQKCEEKYLREENLVEQIRDFIQKVSLPDDWAKNMLLELNKEKEQPKRKSEIIVQNLKKQKIEIEQRIEKLLDIYIVGEALTFEEYQTKKQKLLNEKLDIEQKIRDFEQMGNNRLEPMKGIVFEVKQAKILLLQSDNYQIREFLKNVGLKFILKEKKFNFATKIRRPASPRRGRASLKIYQLAERGGFEPPVPCGTTVFETARFNHSRISPKLAK